MKHTTTVALMLSLGVASLHAQQRPVKMMFSGTGGSSAVHLKYPNTTDSELNFAGFGTLGAFTFRHVQAIKASPEPSSTCSGPTKLYFSYVAGAGAFHFLDGSLLKVRLTQGSDCIDLAAMQAHCTMTFQITGGTGRFQKASGNLTLTETALPLLADATNNVVLVTATGEFTGTISGVWP